MIVDSVDGSEERWTQFTVTCADAPAPKVYVTLLTPMTSLVWLELPLEELQVFAFGDPEGG